MNSSENQLEYRALKEFVRLVDDETSLGMRVRCVICEELTVRQRELGGADKNLDQKSEVNVRVFL